jgi:hypothetical protein
VESDHLSDNLALGVGGPEQRCLSAVAFLHGLIFRSPFRPRLSLFIRSFACIDRSGVGCC